jgi:hypothetical protein
MTYSRAAVALLVLTLAPACQTTDNTTPPPGPSGTGGGSGGRGGSGGGAGGSGGSGSGGSASGGSGGATAGSGGGSSATGGMTGDAGGGDMPGANDCTSMPDSLLCKPLGRMPKTIKATGLFPAAPDFSKVSPRMVEFVPNPPLWSDGMEKQRFLLLPEGTKVDDSNPKEWIFPIGTMMVKTFFDDGGTTGKPRPIETRIIRRIADKDAAVPYDYYLYKWNDDRMDATLIVNDIDGDVTADMPVDITINHMVDGKPLMINGGKAFAHSLPSRNMCGDCHEANGKVGQTFIGFDEVRLNSKRTASATKTQLQELHDAGLFKGAMPANPATITDANPLLLKVKSFVMGNCGHCHNGNEGLEDFRPDVFVKNTVGVAVRPTQSVTPPPGMLRIFPKDIRKSVVYLQTERTMLPPAMGADNRLRPMPPVGVNDMAADQQALMDMAAWINSLPAK